MKGLHCLTASGGGCLLLDAAAHSDSGWGLYFAGVVLLVMSIIESGREPAKETGK